MGTSVAAIARLQSLRKQIQKTFPHYVAPGELSTWQGSHGMLSATKINDLRDMFNDVEALVGGILYRLDQLEERNEAAK